MLLAVSDDTHFRAVWANTTQMTDFGAKKNMMTSALRMIRDPYTRKPTDKNSFWNSIMVLTVFSFGPLSAIITEPTIQRKHPIQPKNVRDSLRNMDDRIAQITTDKAPRGVTTTAS